eukprot:comp21018_c0_seq1/m.28218 comp21018_c0_seq1/g.28218  ORF comp21018_c0_seq1/g.28218 comp21018_c0_seq1/m.28218 type:complete len:485 (-) comp21018_c0_seq1:53-1507(-)
MSEAEGTGTPKRPLEGDSSATEGEGAENKRRRERKKKSGWDNAPTNGAGLLPIPTPAAPVPTTLPTLAAPPSTAGTLNPADVLTAQQQQQLENARKYAATLSIVPSFTLMTGVAELAVAQEKAQKQRALQLMCRIYIGGLGYEATDQEVKQSFIVFGPIRDVSMSIDPVTQKHKGFAFVEFENPEAAMMALEQMNNALMGGRPIKVGRPNNAPQAVPIMEDIQRQAQAHARVYVASIHPELGADDIKEVFGAFGDILACNLGFDLGNPSHKGFGYIEYTDMNAANEAVVAMNLFDLGGQHLRVCRAVTPPMPELLGSAHGDANKAAGVTATQAQVAQATAAAQQAAAAVTLAAAERSGKEDVAKTLHDEENMQISGSSQRFMLMQKLAKKAESDTVVVLRNMVGPDEIDEDLKDEVTEECSNYGSVDKVVIYEEEEDVKIFVRFDSIDGAEKAVAALNGRWFGGRKVTAEVYDGQRFAANDLTG